MADAEFNRYATAVQTVVDIGAAPERAKSQAFFAELANEMRKPHYGEQQAGWMRSLLTRAQERGLYDPKENA
jgi:hypothetical protein